MKHVRFTQCRTVLHILSYFKAAWYLMNTKKQTTQNLIQKNDAAPEYSEAASNLSQAFR